MSDAPRELTPEEVARLEHLAALRASFPLFAEQNLKILNKNGDLVPFRFNSAQRYLHNRLQKQLKETGMVRAIVVKGRQQGISTYVEGRCYHKASMRKGVNVYILTHKGDATDELFSMVERFQRHNPLAPHVGEDNAKTLHFDLLDSKYSVGTAGEKEGGRSKRTTCFHGSEVHFWKNPKAHFAGSVQTVPPLDGTEVILESTGNGVSGEFYAKWQEAVRGIGRYIAIFIPWYWQTEYAEKPPHDFVLNSTPPADGELSEVEYKEMFKLTDSQMYWRRNQIQELGHSKFKQEYPATQDEAFQSDDQESFIKSIFVKKARKRNIEPVGPLLIGVDPCAGGGDRFSVTWRRGYSAYKCKYRRKINEIEAAHWLKSIIDEDAPDRMYIDNGNIGHSVITLLRSYGPKYVKLIRPVNFGATSEFKLARPNVPGPKNRRAEMYKRADKWLQLEEGVSIPDMDELEADLTTPKPKYQESGDFVLESKKDIKARGLPSTDIGDSFVLTFAESKYIEWDESKSERERKPKVKTLLEPTATTHSGGGNGWMAR